MSNAVTTTALLPNIHYSHPAFVVITYTFYTLYCLIFLLFQAFCRKFQFLSFAGWQYCIIENVYGTNCCRISVKLFAGKSILFGINFAVGFVVLCRKSVNMIPFLFITHL